MRTLLQMRRRVVPVVIVLVLALVVTLSVRRSRELQGEKGVYSGTLEAEESRVGSTVGGRIARLLVEEGDEVKAGQLLVVFESDELNASLQAAVAAQRQVEDRLGDLQAGARVPELDQARAALALARDSLAKLKSGSRTEEISAAKATMEQARQKLSLLEAGPRKEDIDRARAEFEGAVADRELADSSLSRAQSLFDDGALSAQDLDRARNAATRAATREKASRRALDALVTGSRPQEIEAARQAHNQARANYELVRKGPRAQDISAAENAARQAEANLALVQAGARPDQIAQAKSALEQASAVVEQVKARVRERAVSTPTSGQVQVLNVQAGDIVSPGQSVATVIDPRNLYLRVYLPQQELGGLRVGSKLPVVTDSGVRVIGTVEHISARAEFTPRNVQTREERALQVFAVKIRIPNDDLRLRAGMSAEARLAD